MHRFLLFEVSMIGNRARGVLNIRAKEVAWPSNEVTLSRLAIEALLAGSPNPAASR